MMAEWEKEEQLPFAVSLARVGKVTCASLHPSCSLLEEIGPWCGGGEEKIGGSGWC